MHQRTRTVSAPLFLCDAFADERFKGNVAAVCLVADSIYSSEWSALNMLESSIGRGQPDKEENNMSEEEREAAAAKYSAERDVKMGEVFGAMAKEVNIAEMAFLYRLPAARLRNVQARIQAKANEFEREYEEKMRVKVDAEPDNAASELAQHIGRRDIVIDPSTADKPANSAPREGEDNNNNKENTNKNANTNNAPALSQGQSGGAGAASAANKAHSPGLIPSTSFSLGIFGASFLDTRGASMLAAAGGSVLGMMGSGTSGHRAPRRLNTQWFGLRWFTPTRERVFCGHSSIAAAHIIYELSRLYLQKYTRKGVDSIPTEFIIPSQTDVLCFVTASEIISVRRKNESETLYPSSTASPGLLRDLSSKADEYEIHFPASEATSVKELLPETMSAAIAEALGLPYGAECVEDVALSVNMGIYVVRLAQPQQVFQCVAQEDKLRALFTTAEFAERLGQHKGKLIEPQGLAVTALNNNQVQNSRGSEADVISRFFAPWIGLLEDSVSATAHTVIAPYMLRHKQSGSYRVGNRVHCFQASERGGYMTCIIIGRKAERIAVTGTVVTFLSGLAFFPVEDDGSGQ